MAKKPKLDDLLNKTAPVKKKAPRQRTKIRQQKYDKSDSMEIEMMRKWIPHLISCDFDRVRSIQLAFPTRKLTNKQATRLARSFIMHAMFTDLMAAHLDTLDDKMGSSERYVLDRLYRQAEANIFDYFTADEHGQLHVKPLSDLPLHQQQNVKKLKISNKVVEAGLERRMIEQTIDIEVVDSFKPVALLGKNMGMFIERVEIDFGKQTADRLEQALERVKQKRLGFDNGREQPKDQPGSPRTIN